MQTLKVVKAISIILGIGLFLMRILFVVGTVFAALRVGLIPTGELFSERLVMIIYVALIGMLANDSFALIFSYLRLLNIKNISRSTKLKHKKLSERELKFIKISLIGGFVVLPLGILGRGVVALETSDFGQLYHWPLISMTLLTWGSSLYAEATRKIENIAYAIKAIRLSAILVAIIVIARVFFTGKVDAFEVLVGLAVIASGLALFVPRLLNVNKRLLAESQIVDRASE